MRSTARAQFDNVVLYGDLCFGFLIVQTGEFAVAKCKKASGAIDKIAVTTSADLIADLRERITVGETTARPLSNRTDTSRKFQVPFFRLLAFRRTIAAATMA